MTTTTNTTVKSFTFSTTKLVGFLKSVLIFAASILAGYSFFAFFAWLVTAMLMLTGLAGTAIATAIAVVACIVLCIGAGFVTITTLGILTLFFGMKGKKAVTDEVKSAVEESVMEHGATPAAA